MLSRQRMDLAADRRGLVGGDAESAVRVGVGRDGVRGGGDSIEGVIVEAGASAVGTCRTAKPPLRIVGVLLPCASRPRRPERLAVRRVGVGAGRTVCVCLRRDKAGGGVATPLRLVPVLAGTPGAQGLHAPQGIISVSDGIGRRAGLRNEIPEGVVFAEDRSAEFVFRRDEVPEDVVVEGLDEERRGVVFADGGEDAVAAVVEDRRVQWVASREGAVVETAHMFGDPRPRKRQAAGVALNPLIGSQRHAHS